MKKIIIIFFILLLCGCSDYKELNDLAIISTIGIDKDKDDYKICMEVLNTNKKNSKNYIIYSEGKTLNEAINKANDKSDKKIYGGHLNQLIVSKDIFNKKNTEIIDSFIRLTEVKDEIDLFLSKEDTACELLETSIKSNKESYKLLDNALKYSSRSSNTNIDTYISNTLKYGIDPVISTIKKDKDNIVIDNIAITSNGKIIKYLNEKETIGYNFIRNEINNFSIPVKYKDKYMTIKINKSRTKNKVYNNKIIININIDAYITEYNLDLDLDDNKTIPKLEKLTEKEIDKYIKKVIKLDTKSNFLGFKRMIYENYKIKTNDYSINTNIKVNLKRKGELKRKI